MMWFKRLDKEKIASLLKEEYGIPEEELEGLKFWHTGRRVWASADVKLPNARIVGIGIVIGKMKGERFLPSNALFKNFTITKRRVVLGSREDAEAFLSGKTVRVEDAPKGIVCVAYKEYNLGKGLSNGKEIASQVPKGHRLKEAYLP